MLLELLFEVKTFRGARRLDENLIKKVNNVKLKL